MDGAKCYRLFQRRMLLVTCLVLYYVGCDWMAPEVVVVNKTAEHILIANPSFNGATWRTILRYGQATSPARCLSGSDHVHFQRFDAHNYCRRQTEYRQIDSLCMCDSSWLSSDTDVVSGTPLFFNYRTISRTDVGYGDFRVIELTLDNMEQDFAVPGPYGH